MKPSVPVLLTTLAAAACAVNPATGEREFSLVSEEQEIQMGREADPQIVASFGLVDDEDLQAYVSGLGRELAAVSERPNLPWTFRVVDDPLVNAFALPGGYIYVTRGILAHFDSEAELAGVLGHEIGHVTARHSASQMSRQQLQQLGLGVGMILSEDVRAIGGLLGAGLQLLNLRYSRGDESQSDMLGLRYIGRLGYDPESMIGVFEMLASAGGGSDTRAPEWALTHPYPENRAEAIRESIREQGLATEGRVEREQFLDHLDGLVFGDNPREGYFKGTRFVHPELEIELTFPEGWNTVNQRTVVAAIDPNQQALVTLQVAEGSDPESALREFLGQEGITAGPASRASWDGMSGARAPFEARTEEGTIRGEVAFIRKGDLLYQLLGYGVPDAWSRHQGSVSSTISSFAQLEDPAILAARPWTLEIRTLDQATSLQSYAARNDTPVELDVLATLNRVTPDEVMEAGRRIKWVVGEPLP